MSKREMPFIGVRKDGSHLVVDAKDRGSFCPGCLCPIKAKEAIKLVKVPGCPDQWPHSECADAIVAMAHKRNGTSQTHKGMTWMNMKREDSQPKDSIKFKEIENNQQEAKSEQQEEVAIDMADATAPF